MTCSKVIGWVLLVSGKIATAVLLLLLVLLLLASICVVLAGLSGKPIAWAVIGTLFGLVLSRLAVWGGRRLAHPLEESHATPQPPDESGEG